MPRHPVSIACLKHYTCLPLLSILKSLAFPDKNSGLDMPTITFTEYIRPNGRTEKVELGCHSATKHKADGLVRKGYRFECEILSDNRTISLTAVDPNDEGDVAIELCRRRSAIPNAVRSLVNKAAVFDSRQPH